MPKETRLRINSELRRVEVVEDDSITLDGSSIPLIIIKQAKLEEE